MRGWKLSSKVLGLVLMAIAAFRLFLGGGIL